MLFWTTVLQRTLITIIIIIIIYGLIPPVIDRLRGHTQTTSVALIVIPLASLMIDQKFRSRRKRSGVCGVTDSRTRLYVTE